MPRIMAVLWSSLGALFPVECPEDVCDTELLNAGPSVLFCLLVHEIEGGVEGRGGSDAADGLA